MSVAEIIEELQNLSLEELKIIAKAIQETAEDCKDVPDVLAVLNAPGIPIPMDEVRKIFGLEDSI